MADKNKAKGTHMGAAAPLTEDSLEKLSGKAAVDDTMRDDDTHSDGTTVVDEPVKNDAPAGRMTESGLAVAQSTLEVARYYSTLMAKCSDEDFAVGSALWLLRDKCQVRIRQSDYASHFLRVPPKHRIPEKYDEFYSQLGLISDPMGSNQPHSWSAGPSDRDAQANIQAIAMAFQAPDVAVRFSGPPDGVPATELQTTENAETAAKASSGIIVTQGGAHQHHRAGIAQHKGLLQGQGEGQGQSGSQTVNASMADASSGSGGADYSNRRGGFKDLFPEKGRNEEDIKAACETYTVFHEAIVKDGKKYIKGSEKALQFLLRTAIFSADSSNPCRFVYVPKEVRSSELYRRSYTDLGLKSDPRNDSHRHLWTIDPKNRVDSIKGLVELWRGIRDVMWSNEFKELMRGVPPLPSSVVNPLNRSRRTRSSKDPALRGPGAGEVTISPRMRKPVKEVDVLETYEKMVESKKRERERKEAKGADSRNGNWVAARSRKKVKGDDDSVLDSMSLDTGSMADIVTPLVKSAVPKNGAGTGTGRQRKKAGNTMAMAAPDMNATAFDLHRHFIGSIEARLAFLEEQNASLKKKVTESEKQVARLEAVNDELRKQIGGK